MLYVGLTGNIASGKSEVARRLAARGATIIDADVLAREAIAPGTAGFNQIVARWGDRVLGADGAIDRAALRKLVFADRSQLNDLNAIVHPTVATLKNTKLAEARRRGDRVVIYAVPLLFEVNMANEFDAIVLVDAPTSVRLERLTRRRKLDPTEAINMIRSQMPAELKRAQSDFIVENGGSLKELAEQTEALWKDLLELPQSRE